MSLGEICYTDAEKWSMKSKPSLKVRFLEQIESEYAHGQSKAIVIGSLFVHMDDLEKLL